MKMMCIYVEEAPEGMTHMLNFFQDDGLNVGWNPSVQEIKNIISNLTMYLAVVETTKDSSYSFIAEL